MAGGILAARLAICSVLLAVAAFLYQIEFPRLLVLVFGIGQTLTPLSSWPYKCRRLEDPRLQACEDMWLSESTRQLFLACSDTLSRGSYMPNGGMLNVSGRSLRDAIIVIDIDRPTDDGGYEMRALRTPGFFGTNGEGELHLLGFTGREDNAGNIQLWVVNAKPSVDRITGDFLDNLKSGANSTVELFQTGPQATSLEHIQTFSNPQIATPNNVAAVDTSNGTGFYFTNDHGLVKRGLKYEFATLLGKGDVSFCDDHSCKEVASGFKFPNGLIEGHDGRIYVPSSLTGRIDVFERLPNNDLKLVECVDIGSAVDNLSVDADGIIYVAGLPVGRKVIQAMQDPFNVFPPVTVFKIIRDTNGYQVEKVIEDGYGEVLPCASTALHDKTTGRLFFGAASAPFIAVCERD